MLPPKERSLLRLIYHRGATHQELAHALGLSTKTLTRTLGRILRRATSPLQLEMVACWDHLDPWEQRLIYLHRVLGMPLRRIAREGLLPPARTDRRAGPTPSLSGLRVRMRAIERKVRRIQSRRSPLPPEEVLAPIPEDGPRVAEVPPPRPER
jgi:hypothetical protein